MVTRRFDALRVRDRKGEKAAGLRKKKTDSSVVLRAGGQVGGDRAEQEGQGE